MNKNGKASIVDRHKCPVCDNLSRNILYITRDRHYGIPGEWNVTACGQCQMVQLAPMLSSEELLDLYPKTFYAYDINKHKKRNKELLKKVFFRSFIVRDPKFEQPGKVLDYGCGTGWSLLKFRNAGWDCVGIEPSENAAKAGREQLGLDIIHGTIHTISPFDVNTFDYIRANHSLEHDPDVSETLSEMRRIIKPDGKLLIGVPNINSTPGRIFKKYWWYLGAPVHTYNYSVKHLSEILLKNRFKVESVRYCGNYTGLIGSLQIYLNRKDSKLVSQDGFVVNFPVFMLAAQCIASIFNLFKSGDAIEVIAKPID